MLGSLADAEDATQDALLRAHRSFSTLGDPKAARAWLYKIATNVCLDRIETRGAETAEIDPCPPALWEASDRGPESSVSARESVAIAFLVALRHLSPRERAALLLRDVMGWSAAEVAGLLDQTVVAVNSALQRARERLPTQRLPSSDASDADTRALLARYVQAWEARDVASLASLLSDDATLTMPPMPAVIGRDAIRALLLHLFATLGEIRVVPLWVSGEPGFAAYHRAPGDAIFRAHLVQAVTVHAGGLQALHTYLSPALFSHFSLALSLDPK
jgi:RNA polymerase sigma-70 factor (ECF subfamily)